MKMLHKVWKKLIWVWNKCQGYEKSAWWYETNDKCSETNTHLKDAHIVLLTDFFRTVFVWCGFVSYHCQWQYTLCTVFLYQAGFVSYHWNYFCTKQIHSCVSLFSWCTTWSTQDIFHNQNESKFVLCATGCTPRMGEFCTNEIFFIPAGTKKFSLVRNPFESFESSEKLGG